ncbi:Crp/Fnr family transcriptional regulator [Sphingomonas quercus]|uniref:Crp/Fnr family transcriptional regulator n=1 Tax=Sphingomonas quercus TaxID=2842451 RepID=A0ABS6BER8_9SPHN|nr:Crp/Fnr family transcriptional regulator [Sphingomonas quercus]MBU3076815.1 Crp/Fnr family transcriptional regulator [Sphingomonas quercus]
MPNIPWDLVPLDLPGEVTRRAIPRRFAPQQDLFLQGELPVEIFVLISGRTKVWRLNEHGVAATLLMLGGGEVVGTLGMINGTTNPVSVSAIDAVTAVSWPVSLLREAMAGSAKLANGLLRIVTRRAAQLVDRFDDVANRPVEERLARLLLRLAGELPLDDEALTIVLELRQQEVADMCFSTVPTISRTLAAWERSDVVEVSRGRIRINHVSQLAMIAGIPVD